MYSDAVACIGWTWSELSTADGVNKHGARRWTELSAFAGRRWTSRDLLLLFLCVNGKVIWYGIGKVMEEERSKKRSCVEDQRLQPSGSLVLRTSRDLYRVEDYRLQSSRRLVRRGICFATLQQQHRESLIFMDFASLRF